MQNGIRRREYGKESVKEKGKKQKKKD